MRTLFHDYAGKPVGVKDLQKVTEDIQGEQLTWFYSQWLDSTGAPEFKDKYTVSGLRRASAWWGRYSRIWTCSGCRWS